MLLRRPRALFVAALLVVSCIVSDRLTKYEAMTLLRGRPAREMAGGAIRFAYAENRGAMLSFGAALPEPSRFWLLTVGVGLLLLGMLAVLLFAKHLSRTLVAGLALMLGGGASNFFDRLLNDGRVVDFVTLGWGAMRTGVFNLADVAITFGVSLFFVAVIRRHSNLQQ
ncbi:MAG TPA: signal peptidase II [Bacteroidota bacterium]|nr:signal peptidase II [Bacteroidota bacterium]